MDSILKEFFRQDLQDKQDFLTVFRPPAHRAYGPEGRKRSNPIAFGEEIHTQS
jgi:hypothetical protein